MTDWIALSDRECPPPPAVEGDEAPLAVGALVVELALPLAPGLLLDWQAGQAAGERALALFVHPDAGLVVMERRGPTLRRHRLPPVPPAGGRSLRLTFGWDLGGAGARLQVDTLDDGAPSTAPGQDPVGLSAAEAQALCRGEGVRTRAPGVLWYGVTRGTTPPARAPWIGLSTPLTTARGLIPAGLVRAGDRLIGRDGTVGTVRSARRLDLPARGVFAPVVLRAPFFTRHRDLLVSAEQPVAIGGIEVEYLFGEDEVLVEAGHLVDGRAALPPGRRATVTGVEIDAGPRFVVEADGCGLLTASALPAALTTPPPLRLLRSYEARPLMALLRRVRRAAAA
jgi:hypothetical protein